MGEAKTRLFRSNVPWLLVFDNVEGDEWRGFVPNGAGVGGCHVLATTRRAYEVEEAGSGEEECCHGTLTLGCLNTSEVGSRPIMMPSRAHSLCSIFFPTKLSL